MKRYEHPSWGLIEVFDARNDEVMPHGKFYAWQRNSYPPLFITKGCNSLGKCLQGIVFGIAGDLKKQAQEDKKNRKGILSILPNDTSIPGSFSYLKKYEI